MLRDPDFDIFYGAPALIVIASMAESPWAVEDCSLAAENLMLLSLSFEEYERWAEELRRLQPGNPILSGHRPAVLQAQEAGQPWWGVLGGNALMHHDPHDPRAVRRSSQAAATWRAMLQGCRALPALREAMARISTQDPRCMAGMTFSVPICATTVSGPGSPGTSIAAGFTTAASGELLVSR